MPLRRQLTLYAVLVLVYLLVANPDLSAWLPSFVPIPTGDFRVLLIRETADPLPKDQQAVFDSTQIVAYLNERCAKVDGRPGWRKWDDDVDVSNASPEWQAILAAVKPAIKTLPALVVLRGTNPTVYPLTNEADALAILRKAGG